jgi:hypothetical protein
MAFGSRAAFATALFAAAMPRRGMAAAARAAKPNPSAASSQCATDYHNCWTSRRCCSEGSRCYTKAADLRFAQCRPQGCVGTCAWECKVLDVNPTSAIVEYGEGAQNLSQAVAALKRPLPVALAGRPPGRSERLGNVIDSWYFGSLGAGPPLAHLISLSCGMETCFARFLATQLGAISVGAEQSRAAFREAGRHKSWGLYSYPTIGTLMPQLRHDLRAAMKAYAARHDPALVAQEYEGGRRHLVLHYRLGDFVTNGWCVPPADVARAAAALDPSVIELMDGGVRHLDQVDGYSASPHRPNRTRQRQALALSATLQRELEAALRAASPAARVVRSPTTSIDGDWFRCAHAPLLVTAAGSFAVTAAVAGHGRQIRTPASENLNFPNQGVRASEQMAPNWQTYVYDTRAMQG